MKLFIATHNLTKHNSHLMPWRHICETTKYLREAGHRVTLVSLSSSKGKLKGSRLPASAIEIRKAFGYFHYDIREIVDQELPHVIYWPLSWRESCQRTKIVGRLAVPLVGYFPGGCHSLNSTLYAMKRIGFRAALPYMLEAISPKSMQLRILKANRFRRLIAMTTFTTNTAIAAGWPKNEIFTIPPGRDPQGSNAIAQSLVEKVHTWLDKRQFYLFMGPPSRIRGVHELLKAFDKAADKIEKICLVCLFRSDPISDRDHIRSQILKLKNRDRVLACWESVDKQTLNAFLNGCHAVVLPFVLVPSEIPLAIIESMAWSKPVITTKLSGTGEFVKPFGLVTTPGKIPDLAKAIVDLIKNTSLYTHKSKIAFETFQKHPTSQDVAFAWLKAAQAASNE